ncbi:uncharacterized protein LOC9638781 isoform X1 [Selaginella moellendorffii]|uniref:uncharacterized protein LOC9638781 isoform X1 n=1 Tax=Selaginella moellendorffii TaxID=88036 RepID=UPI000D1C3966|nr:uncharacterized protein LOC9638781 isoform X1 [Selaginella moellendorffii]|eukprot:XP_024537778.1 uncharacterized protein LOC9638781 isoform X1 [Selaginella moellendorffii]
MRDKTLALILHLGVLARNGRPGCVPAQQRQVLASRIYPYRWSDRGSGTIRKEIPASLSQISQQCRDFDVPVHCLQRDQVPHRRSLLIVAIRRGDAGDQLQANSSYWRGDLPLGCRCLAGWMLDPAFFHPGTMQVSPGHAPPRQLKYAALSTWQLVPLWLALLINIILRSVQPQPRERILKESSNLALAQRVASLEHDFLGSVTLIRALTRQLEKLGVRVQVTKRTLQDPIHQTAKLAADMASAVKALSHRETLLEEELKETRSALMAIQDQQAKQLELISLLASRLSSSNRQGQKAAKKKMNDDYKYDYWLANTGEEICTLDSKR